MKIDHLAIQVECPRSAADWYVKNWSAELVYVDDTWGVVQFENIKLAFVIETQHPPHFAFEAPELDVGKAHRDGSKSVYKQDPWGNFFELIKY